MTFFAPKDNLDDRPLGRALAHGWRKRCPRCGGGSMMRGYLTVRQFCTSCGEPLHHHRADDMPAWATILIVGHLIAPILIWVETGFRPPLWVQGIVWPVVAGALVFHLLPRVKGMVVAMQWSWRMHGFGNDAT